MVDLTALTADDLAMDIADQAEVLARAVWFFCGNAPGHMATGVRRRAASARSRDDGVDLGGRGAGVDLVKHSAIATARSGGGELLARGAWARRVAGVLKACDDKMPLSGAARRRRDPSDPDARTRCIHRLAKVHIQGL